MPEITYKRRGELIRKVFQVLRQSPNGLPAKEVLARVEAGLPLTDFEKSTYPNRPNVRRFEKIVRFSSIPHVKAGWLIKGRSGWTITEEGQKAYDQLPNPEKFDREAVRLYRDWASSQQPDEEPEQPEIVPASTTLEEAQETAWTEIEEYLKGMNPYDFQHLVAALLSAMGYHVAWVSTPGPDRGIDILAHTDPLGTKPPRIKVQVKRRADKVDVDGLRAFMALLGDQDVGIFVSTGGFTGNAQTEARTSETRKITLLDLEKFVDLWIDHQDKIEEEDRRRFPLTPVHFLAPTEKAA